MDVQSIYDGSDGEATRSLYARLATLGPVGTIAVGLFRAQKASARAKVYRGGIRGQGSFRGMAYQRKGWALEQLAGALLAHGSTLGLRFGWGPDDFTPGFPWVLYVDLPTGQVSFHAATRGGGPDYAGQWDGVRGVSADRIVRWCQALLGESTPPVLAETTPAPRWLWCRDCAAFWANRARCPLHPRVLLEVKVMPRPKPELRPGVRAEWDDDELAAI